MAATSWVIKGSALKLAAFTAGMFAFGYALVPLYNMVCEAIGLGPRGVMQISAAALPAVDTTRTITVEFTTTVNTGGQWQFQPKVERMQVHPGELATANFVAQNLSSVDVIGQAIPNIAPMDATRYFRKTECFCFEKQNYAANESKEMPVRFVIDPELPAYIDTVTLSYTYFDVTQTAQAAAGAESVIRN